MRLEKLLQIMDKKKYHLLRYITLTDLAKIPHRYNKDKVETLNSFNNWTTI